MGEHKDETTQHRIHTWEYANAAARTGATGFTSDDLDKVAKQTDDDTYYILTATTPTWTQIDAAGGGDVSGPGSSSDNAVARFDGTGGKTLQNTSPVTISDIGVIATVVEDAVTNAFTELLQLTHNSSGTPAAGLGAAIEMLVETSTTEGVSVGQLAMEWAVITHASRRGRLRVLLDDAGTATEVMVLGGPSQYGTNAIGNARGEGAVDLQGYRTGATQVAAAADSAILGGAENVIASSAADSAIIAGIQNEIPADVFQAIILGGVGAKASFYSQVLNTNTYFSTVGDAQGTIQVCVSRQVTHSTTGWYELYADNSNDQLLIPTDTVWSFEALITGATSGLAKTFGFHILGMIENDGGVTAIKGTPTVTTIDNSDDVSFGAQASADDTNDALKIEVQDTDGASDVVRWFATVRTAELTYA
jgi:hypothetical protein